MTDIQTTTEPARPVQAPFDPSAADRIEAAVNHLVATGAKPAVVIGSSYVQNTSVQTLPVSIASARPIAGELDLDLQGFALVEHDTAVTDFYDDEQVEDIYYREAAALLRAATGASKVVIFDHTRRKEAADPDQSRGPVRRAHNDYTEVSGPQRVRDLLDAEEAAERLEKRFAIVNVWRPINHPVETTPLAIADARSVTQDDFIATDLVYPDRVGEIYHVAPNPAHDWYYVPLQRPEEVILLKVFDSARDGRARWTAHTAVDDPNARADAPPRESIELRALVFFDE
jgi:hypothetical protein